MTAVPQPRETAHERSRANAALELIQGSMSAQKVARRSPLLASCHRAADGGLLGVFLAVVVLSGLTLHWQHRWTMAFRQLEVTRSLSHRLTESTAMLEQHLLEKARLPRTLVPTKASDLVYLERPAAASQPPLNHLAMIGAWMDGPIHQGY
ncbi:hypothetical protein [Synechococcus sp. HK01-R]|uniref:hypothetical protein n=1 Tax=Synechococcus sp. HK01-R TaxID=2751171 RepID=UPI001625B52C|nr:hypothetical protein [Synechococcus sp. HK01-R]QNG26239.1 hypothetical protein H0O21_08060 [Synechococcus sp. HK01-R]